VSPRDVDAQCHVGCTLLWGADTASVWWCALCVCICLWVCLWVSVCLCVCDTQDGDDPLHWACEVGCEDVVRYLVEKHGADVGHRNKVCVLAPPLSMTVSPSCRRVRSGRHDSAALRGSTRQL
jgi:ankyrin repeat protein